MKVADHAEITGMKGAFCQHCDCKVVMLERLQAFHCSVERVRASCAEYIADGPLLPLCGLERSAVLSNMNEWMRLGDVIINILGFPPKEELNSVQRWAIFSTDSQAIT